VSWIKSLHNYAQNYSSQLSVYQFEEVERQNGPGMGAVICYKNSIFCFDLINDKGQFFLSIGSNNSQDEKHDISFVIALIDIKKNNQNIYELTFDEKIKYWKIKYDYNDPLRLFFDNVEELARLVNEQQYRNTTDELKYLLNDRGKWLFNQ
jgi:hypothetical protein